MNHRSLARYPTWDVLNRQHSILARRTYQQRKEKRNIAAVAVLGFLVLLIGIIFTTIGAIRSTFVTSTPSPNIGALVPGCTLLVLGSFFLLASLWLQCQRCGNDNSYNRTVVQAPSRQHPHHRYHQYQRSDHHHHHQQNTTSSPATGAVLNVPSTSRAVSGSSTIVLQPIPREARPPSAPPSSNPSPHPQHRADDLPPSYDELFSQKVDYGYL